MKPERSTCELVHREYHLRETGALDAEMKRHMVSVVRGFGTIGGLI